MEVTLRSSAAFASPPSFAVAVPRLCPCFEVLHWDRLPVKRSGGLMCFSFDKMDTGYCLSARSVNRSTRYKRFPRSLRLLEKRFIDGSEMKTHYVTRLRKFSISLHKVLQNSRRFNGHFLTFSLHIIAGAMIVMTMGATITKAPSWALSKENLLFLEAWRTIDRAYIDKNFNGQNWFRYRETALRNEPMNTREETYAAIRKMVATLDDPFTRFVEPQKFKSLRGSQEHKMLLRESVCLLDTLPKKIRLPLDWWLFQLHLEVQQVGLEFYLGT